MDRRKAITVAAASTLFVGTTIVAGASMGGYSLFGFGRHHADAPVTAAAAGTSRPERAAPKIITRYKDMFDAVTVDIASRSAGSNDGAVAINPALAASPTTGAPHTTDDDSSGAKTSSGGSHISTGGADADSVDEPEPEPTPTTDTTPPVGSPSTTAPSQHYGDQPYIPPDWPADQPIPPIPTSCHEPRLSLSGVWHCDD